MNNYLNQIKETITASNFLEETSSESVIDPDSYTSWNPVSPVKEATFQESYKNVPTFKSRIDDSYKFNSKLLQDFSHVDTRFLQNLFRRDEEQRFRIRLHKQLQKSIDDAAKYNSSIISDPIPLHNSHFFPHQGKRLFSNANRLVRREAKSKIVPQSFIFKHLGHAAGSGFVSGATDGLPTAIDTASTAFFERVDRAIDNTFSNICGQISNSTDDLLDFSLQLGELGIAFANSDDLFVKTTLVVAFIHRIISALGITKMLYKITRQLVQFLIKHVREIGVSICDPIIDMVKSCFHMTDHVTPETVPQAWTRKSLVTPITIGVILHFLRMSIDYITKVAKDWWVTSSWRFAREHLKNRHYNLFMLLEGNRLIRDSGGPNWLHSSSNNAVFGARVGYYANLCRTQYETDSPPIDKFMLNDAIRTAQNNALFAGSLINGARPGAVVTYFYGPTKQGKTHMTNKISSRLLRGIGAPPGSVFTFPITSAYKDGYVGQPMVFLSDAFKLCSQSDRVPEVEFLMKCHDEDPYPLDMAKCEDKGAVFFNSPFVIATSNVNIRTNPPTSLGLSDHDALLSRIDFYINFTCTDQEVMENVSEFASDPLWVIDEHLMDLKYPHGAPDNIFRLELVHSRSGKFKEVLTVDQLVSRIEALRKRRYRRFLDIEFDPPWEEIDELIETAGFDNHLPPVITYETPYFAINTPPQNFEDAVEGLVPQACIREHPAIKIIAQLYQEASKNAKYLADAAFTPFYNSWKATQKFMDNVDPVIKLTLGCVGLYFISYAATRYYQRSRKRELDDTEPEARYDVQKIVKPKLIRFRARGENPLKSVIQKIHHKMEGLEHFIEEEFPVGPQVEDIEIIPPNPLDRIDSEFSEPIVRQGCDDLNALQMIGYRLMNQLYWFEARVPTVGKTCCGQMLCLSGTLFSLPLHLWTIAKRADIITMFGSHNYEIDMSYITHVADLPDQEIALISFSRDIMPDGRNILSKFVSNDEISRVGDKVLTAARLFDNNHSAGYFGSCNSSIVSSKGISEINSDCEFHIATAIKYPLMQTFVGMCGAPVITMTGSVTGKICGIHCAGSSNGCGGYAAIVTREILEPFIERTPNPQPLIAVVESNSETSTSGFMPWGVVDQRLIQAQHLQTGIRPSKLYGAMQISPNEPACLTITNGINPMVKGQKKWIGVGLGPNKFTIDRVFKYIGAHLAAQLAKHDMPQPRILSPFEAVNGIDGYLEGVNLHSSPGFPFNKLLTGNKLSWVRVNDNNKVVEFHPFLVDAMEHIEETISKDETPFVVFRDALKDETRSIEKIDSVSTRVFCGAPFDYTVVFKQYFGDVIAQLQQINLDIPISIGVDAHSNDWGVIFRAMRTIPGQNFVTGDCKNFDGSELAAMVLSACREALIPLLQMPNLTSKLMCLCRAFAFALHICENLIYMLNKGLPSGTPVTSLVNCLVLWGLMCLAWIRCGYSLEDFMIHTYWKFYGDDSLGKIHPDFDKFNQLSIRDSFAECGMEYTNADKKSDLIPYTAEEDVVFLQRKFVERNGKVFAPLPLSTIYDIPNWTRGEPQQEDDNLIGCYRSFCQEMSHYPEDQYYLAVYDLQSKYAKRGIVVDPPNYLDLMRRYL